MCGRFVTWFIDEDGILRPRDVPDNLPDTISYDFRPSESIHALGWATGNNWSLQPMTWGFVPENVSNSEDLSRYQKRVTNDFNVRLESCIRQNFDPFSANQKALGCIIPALGWFEWKMEGRYKKKFFIQHADKSPMGFLGQYIHNGFLNRTTFAIITRKASTDIRHIHARQPVVLNQEEILQSMEGRFNDGSFHDLPENENLDFYEVNNVTDRGAGNLKAYDPDDLTTSGDDLFN